MGRKEGNALVHIDTVAKETSGSTMSEGKTHNIRGDPYRKDIAGIGSGP